MSNIQPIKLTIHLKDTNGKLLYEEGKPVTKEVVFKCIAKEHYDETRSDIMFRIQETVQNNNLPIAKLIETKHGAGYIDIGDYYISLNEFVKGDSLDVSDRQQLKEFGNKLAEIHNKLIEDENLEREQVKDENKWSPAKSIESFPTKKEINEKIKELESENFFDDDNKLTKQIIATFLILWEGKEYDNKKITNLIDCGEFKELTENIKEKFNQNELDSIIHIAFLWGEKYGERNAFNKINYLIKNNDRNFKMLVAQMSSLEKNWKYVEQKDLLYAFIHSDLNYGNLFFNKGKLTGIIDWEHSDYFLRAMELARIFADTQEP